jgi:signal transduction histidine kinase
MKNKIEIWVYGTLFAILIGGSLWLCFDLVREHDRIVDNSTQIAIEKSKFMSQWLRNVFLSSDYVIRDVRDKVSPNELIHASSEKNKKLNSWLGEKAKTVFGLSAIGIYDSNHIYRADNLPAIISFRTNLKMPTSQTDDKVTFTYMPVEKSANKKPTILISRGIFSQAGKGIGGISGAIDLEFAQKWIKSFHVGAGDILLLMDENGTLLAANPASAHALGGKTNFFQQQSGGHTISGSSSSLFSSQIDGVHRIYGITRMDELPIVLVVGYDMNNTLKEWRHRAWQISCGFLALMVLAFFAVRAYMKSLRQGKELLVLATKAEKANSTKDKIFSIIAHDLKGPIGYMMSFADLFSEEEAVPSEDIQKFIGFQKELTRSTYHLLDNLLSWAKENLNQIQMQPALISLNEIIEGILGLSKYPADKKRIEIKYNPSKPYQVYADSNLVNLIVRNLLNNAIKFTPENGTITITVSETPTEIEVKIIDSGVGMEKETIQKILSEDEFYSSRGTDNEKGTGLGLKLVKNAVELSKGSLDIESKLQEGSCFTFTLPRNKC